MIDQFMGFKSVGWLKENGYSEIPSVSGVYIVVVPDGFKVNFLDTTTAITERRGRNTLTSSQDLAKKFLKTDQRILYIGKAANLRNRISQLIRYAYGKADNHYGGCHLWQIENNPLLEVGYLRDPSPESTEQRLLKQYVDRQGLLPVANRR
jgi:hypothetical protein